jgi:hypothetical protein
MNHDGPVQMATAQEVLELTLWCQRLATMVSTCCQPHNIHKDLEWRLQQLEEQLPLQEETRTRLRGVEKRVHHLETESHSSPRRHHGSHARHGRSYSDDDIPSPQPPTSQNASIGLVGPPGDHGAVDHESTGYSSRGHSPDRYRPTAIRVNSDAELINEINPDYELGPEKLSVEIPDSDEERIEQREEEFAESEESEEVEGVALGVPGGARSFEKTDSELDRAERLQKVEEIVRTIEIRGQVEEKRLKRLESGASASTGDSGNAWFDIQTEESGLTYQVQPSIWDATALLFFHMPPGLPIGSYTTRLSIILTFFANLFMQSTLIMSIYLGMLDNPFDDDKLRQMRNWREAQFNISVYNKLADGALELTNRALMLCNQTDWSWEQDEYNDLFSYSRKNFSFRTSEIPGIWLGFLCVTVWMCCIFIEYEAWALHLRGLYCIPRGEKSVVAQDDEGLKVESCNKVTKVVIFITILIPRVSVLGALLLIGSKYVAHTYVFSDILLNCVALTFVLDMDETLFNVILPVSVRHTIEVMTPIPISRVTFLKRCSGDVEIADMVRWTLMGAFLCGSWVAWIKPFADVLADAENFLCPGESGAQGGKRRR